MEITANKQGDITILTVNGKMDASNATEFEAKVKEEMAAGANRFVVDLSQLAYISSAGLRSMLFLAKSVKTSSGAAVLCGLNGVVQEVFKISGFSALFTVCDDRQQAIQSC